MSVVFCVVFATLVHKKVTIKVILLLLLFTVAPSTVAFLTHRIATLSSSTRTIGAPVSHVGSAQPQFHN